MANHPIINRELSWLSFNERVLQEAEDKTVPLIERLKFLGIFSNNLDEFFRVRVATIARLIDFQKQAKQDLGLNPAKLLDEIQDKIELLQKRFNQTFQVIQKELEKEKILIINEKQLDKEQGLFVKKYFQERVRLEIFPIMIDKMKAFPVLQDSSIYLAVRIYKTKKEPIYSLIEVPSHSISRFVVLPPRKDKQYILFLDDVIRFNLKDVFQIYDFDKIDAYTIKFTRDAELDIDNDISTTFLESVEKSLEKRKKGEAIRFIYDAEMPKDFLNFLVKKMNLDKETHVVGSVRYHNFKDFIRFPDLGRTDLLNPAQTHIAHPDLHKTRSILAKMKEKDILLHFPYHSFDYFLDLLREAAIDPNVSHIRVTLYRVSSNSHVIKSLITALHNGKDVTVFIELRARFDEEANIEWANKLRDAGARVITGIAGLKVHSKLCLITRREKGKKIYYACIGTGNLHEKTARIYTDLMVLTSNQVITKEARQVFTFFDKNYSVPKINKLLIAPFNLRSKLTHLINKEIKHAREGKKAEVFFKLNNLVDEDMINKLYNASKAGVKVKLIIRGICSLIPNIPGISENIEAISIVDKFLEHSRVFIFHNDGKPEYYFGSADLMTRNLDFRIEIVTPVLDDKLQKLIQQTMTIQWNDTVKARVFNKEQNNVRKLKTLSATAVRSQDVTYNFWKEYAGKKKSK
ncbi:MAG: polyphosphate kinase 1 [Sphingobacteriales bacterium]|nr:polyphosphate kinase 1 [Sphingobacteriales bacterium]